MQLSVSVICWLLIFSEDYKQSFSKNVNYTAEAMWQCLTKTIKMIIKD